MPSELEKLAGPNGSLSGLVIDLSPPESALFSPPQFDVVHVESLPSVPAVGSAQPRDRSTLDDVHRLAAGRRLGLIVARHVVEHAPDLVGWLHSLARVAEADTLVSLQIPDNRFTFDAYRNPSTLGEVFAASALQRTRASVEQVFDSSLLGTPVDCRAAWGKRIEPSTSTVDWERLPWARQRALEAVGGGSVNVHCWVFTPTSFLFILEGLARLDLLPFKVEHIYPTEIEEYDFVVGFRKCDDTKAILDSISAAQTTVAEDRRAILHLEASAPHVLKCRTLEQSAQARLQRLSVLEAKYLAVKEELIAAELEVERLEYRLQDAGVAVAGR